MGKELKLHETTANNVASAAYEMKDYRDDCQYPIGADGKQHAHTHKELTDQELCARIEAQKSTHARDTELLMCFLQPIIAAVICGGFFYCLVAGVHFLWRIT
jgi:hypothetical protein